MKLYTRIALTFTIAFSVVLMISYLLVFYFAQQIIFNENRSNLIKFDNYLVNIIDENKDELMTRPEGERLSFLADKIYPYIKDNTLVTYKIMDDQGHAYLSNSRYSDLMDPDTIKKNNIDLFKNKITDPDQLSSDVSVNSFRYEGSEYYYIDSSYSVTPQYTVYIQAVKNLDDSLMFMTVLYALLIILMLISLAAIILLGIYGTKRSLKPLIEIADTARDITENNLNVRIKQTGNNDELDQMITSLNQMISQLESAFSVQKQFVSDASHELRMPLTILQGYYDILNTWGKDDPKIQQEAMDSMETEIKNMQTIVDDLLLLTRLENKYYSEQFKRVDLSQSLKKACQECEMIDPDHHYTVTADQSCPVHCNPGLIAQALRAVLDNSIKYTPPGGTIALSCSCEDDLCRVAIADTGIGIPEKDLENVKKRFFRVDSDRSRNTGGIGLGLSIIDSIVTLHKGTLAIESTPNNGTQVIMTFPKDR